MRKRFLSFGIVLALLVMLFTTTAFANAPTARAATQPHRVGCIPGDGYVNVANWGVNLVHSSPKFGQSNPYSTSISKTWSASTTFSSTVSASGSVEANLNAIFAGVKATVNTGISFTISGTYSDSITVVIPPHQTRYAQYGLFQQVAYGDYQYVNSSCQVTDLGYQESWSPWYVGWDLS